MADAGRCAAYRLADRLAGADRVIAIVPLSLACCSVEISAAVEAGLLVPAGPEHAESSLAPDPAAPDFTILVVAGTVTGAMAPAVAAAWAELPDPKAAIAFGACASSGGPYWDAPSVSAGADRTIPVQCYVPGCPPRPQALVDALHQVIADTAPWLASR